MQLSALFNKNVTRALLPSMCYSVSSVTAATQIWEQEFAWTEADKPIKLAARALTVPASSSLNKQPIFCFSTMMKMWYWSALVYDYQRVSVVSHLDVLQGRNSECDNAITFGKQSKAVSLSLTVLHICAHTQHMSEACSHACLTDVPGAMDAHK